MIEHLEIRNSSRALIGIIDTAQSIIWKEEYYGVGDFEIYVQASQEILSIIDVGNYVTRPDNRNVGIIESVNIDMSISGGQMATISGRFAKSILARRLIYNLSGNTVYPVVSSGNVESAVRALVNKNIISATDSARNVSFFKLGALAGITKKIVDDDGKETQVQTSYENLQTYTDGLLREYGLGAYVALDRSTLNLLYNVYEGKDRSAGNASGNIPLVFSQEFDNLLSAAYSVDETAYKNAALIGGEGEGTERFYSLVSYGSGINRRELFIDGSSQSKTYKDDSDTEHTYSDTEYNALLISKARQELSDTIIVENFSGEIDIANSGLTLNEDFSIGDIVTIQDNQLAKYINVRIIKITEVQDESGYNINIEFEE